MISSQTLWKTGLVKKLVDLALEEDLPGGDLTTMLCLGKGDKSGVGRIVARQACMVCGTGVVETVLEALGSSDFQVEILIQDGQRAEGDGVIAEIRGEASVVLSAERTILNFMQRLSGIATHVAAIVEKAQGLAVLDTRKTSPGWRILEKYAVRTGGGRNHRMNLSEMIMIKDNHIDLSGLNLAELLSSILDEKPEYTPVEIEIRTQAELESISGIPVNAILLDNMNDDGIKRAIEFIQSNWSSPPLIEISGNITTARFHALRQIGVDRVSMGVLTYGATAVDLALELATS